MPRAKPRPGCVIDPSHPLSRGCVGLWLFNENGGTVLHDISGNRNDGTLTNMDPSSAWVGSPNGGALDFDGTNDYLPLQIGRGLPIFSFANPYSIVIRFKASSNTNLWLYSEGLTSDDTPIFGFRSEPGSTDKIQAFIRNTAGTNLAGNNPSVKTVFDGSWHDFVWTDNAGTVLAYIDGRIDSGISVNYTPASTLAPNTATIAALVRSSVSGYMPVMVNVVRIHSRVLSADEIRWLYEEPFDNILQPKYRKYFISSTAPATTRIRDMIGFDIFPKKR